MNCLLNIKVDELTPLKKRTSRRDEKKTKPSTICRPYYLLSNCMMRTHAEGTLNLQGFCQMIIHIWGTALIPGRNAANVNSRIRIKRKQETRKRGKNQMGDIRDWAQNYDRKAFLLPKSQKMLGDRKSL